MVLFVSFVIFVDNDVLVNTFTVSRAWERDNTRTGKMLGFVRQPNVRSYELRGSLSVFIVLMFIHDINNLFVPLFWIN
jgi:hypothetical protein